MRKKRAATSAVRSRRRRKVSLGVLAVGALLALAGCSIPIDGNLVAFDQPAQSARYSFHAQINGTSTVWEYTSAKPTTSDTVPSEPCVSALVQKSPTCRPEPLIFLKYDLGLGLDNTVEAGGVHHITVTGYYQERLSALPTVNALGVETTLDGGRTWHPAGVRASGANSYAVDITNPARGEAPSGVGLRVSATDSAGDTVVQTIPHAYQVR
ncbi:hypothetical protein [Streptomyces sp. NPDC020917]|uniref:hypothetical protein n=1 Tax=Streptomyces sp. NPDC020917 TaxID=3365102 RepID=UPI0037913301